VIDHVRSSIKPAFLILNTYRLGPHSKGDDFRDPNEIEKNRSRDPLQLAAEQIPEKKIREFQTEISAQIEKVFKKVFDDDNPTMEVLK
jgi:2-oxoisovalerate dehydrogenase E1 component